jgi:hypothetical protein
VSGPRWRTYDLADDDAALREAWAARLVDGARVAIVMGIGFDPRMCLALELFRELSAPLDVHAVQFDAPADAIARSMADENAAYFGGLLGDTEPRLLPIGGSGLEETSRSAAAAVKTLDEFGDVTDIVVDVNALPRPVFFPLLAKLLFLCDKAGPEAPNLHVLAGDAAWLDAAIRTDGLDEHASWLHPFEGTFSVEATQHMPRVWIPILGEHTATQLERISELVDPAEVCPMLPFPARDPRRGDRLFEEYLDFLFERLRTDSGTVIYADEANPFQVYRRLRDSTLRHAETLAPLGQCKTAYSALSSKVVALGVLLVAYELREAELPEAQVGVADIGGQLHVVERKISREEAAEGTRLVGACLSGDSYL